MKKALIALGVLAFLYPVLAWLMGFAIEHRVTQLATESGTLLPQLRLTQASRSGFVAGDETLTYELGTTFRMTRHYHRGWFSSVDQADVEFSAPALNGIPGFRTVSTADGTAPPAPAPLRISIRTVIHHGPVCGWTCLALADSESHVTFNGVLQDSLNRLFGGKEPVRITSRFSFLGGGSGTISSPAFERAQMGQDAFVSWGGIQGTAYYGRRRTGTTRPSAHRPCGSTNLPSRWLPMA